MDQSAQLPSISCSRKRHGIDAFPASLSAQWLLQDTDELYGHTRRCHGVCNEAGNASVVTHSFKEMCLGLGKLTPKKNTLGSKMMISNLSRSTSKRYILNLYHLGIYWVPIPFFQGSNKGGEKQTPPRRVEELHQRPDSGGASTRWRRWNICPGKSMELEDVFNYWNFSPLNQGRNLGIRELLGFLTFVKCANKRWKTFEALSFQELDEPMSFTIDDLYPSSLVAFFHRSLGAGRCQWRRSEGFKWVSLSFIEEGNKISM